MIPNTGQYLYDANANMTYDPSKKITVSYNPLNLPSLVEFDNNDFIEYTYSATGTKLRKTVTSWKTTTGGTTDYAGQFLYQDNELSCIFTPVGRIVPMQYNDETFWKHEYNLKDHLGNTRIVFAAHPHGQPEVMQQTSYYPFGMTLQQQNFGGALSQPNKLLYNGKELQDDELAGLSLDWYDYGARFYDAALGRWHVVDPLAEERKWLSPYNYVQNNPIMRIDPDGALDDGYIDMQGNYKWFDDKTADVIERDDKLWVKVTDDKNIFNMATAGILDNVPELTDPGEIKPYSPNIFVQAEEYINSPSFTPEEATGKFALGVLYGVADDIMVYGSNLVLGPSKARHLNNSCANRSEITNSGLNTITTFVPVGSFGKGIGIGKQTVNASKFGSLFKGESVLKGSHQLRGLNIRKYNQTIRTNNSFNSIFPYFNYSPLLLNPSTDTNQNK